MAAIVTPFQRQAVLVVQLVINFLCARSQKVVQVGGKEMESTVQMCLEQERVPRTTETLLPLIVRL